MTEVGLFEGRICETGGARERVDQAAGGRGSLIISLF